MFSRSYYRHFIRMVGHFLPDPFDSGSSFFQGSFFFLSSPSFSTPSLSYLVLDFCVTLTLLFFVPLFISFRESKRFLWFFESSLNRFILRRPSCILFSSNRYSFVFYLRLVISLTHHFSPSVFPDTRKGIVLFTFR